MERNGAEDLERLVNYSAYCWVSSQEVARDVI